MSLRRSRTWVVAAMFAVLMVSCTRPWGGKRVVSTPVIRQNATSTPRVRATFTMTMPPTATAIASPTTTITLTSSPTPTWTPTPAAYGPTDFPPAVDPLTGLLVEDPAVLDRHPVMVKVSNFPRSLRPHSGLSSADLVFEYYIGAGATRFTALFYGQDAAKVGPVRSARLIDASIGRAYQGVLAFASADPYVFSRVVDALGVRAITEGPLTCPGLCRTGNGDVNSVFVDTALFSQYAVEEHEVPPERPPLEGMRFDAAVPLGGERADYVEVQYSFFARSGWRYDESRGKYLRWIEQVDAQNNISMVELTDRETGEQLAFSNVVVLFAYYNELKPTLHEIEILGNTQGRRALLFRDGQVFELTWKAVASNQPIQFFSETGEVMAFKPGNTWFEVVGVSSTVEETAQGEWEVKFFLP